MRQLSALDAGLLDLESPTATGHVGTLVGVDPRAVGGWGADQVAALLESRLPGLGSLRQRLVSGPLGFGGWYLWEDPHFDLEFHVRGLALPAPGTAQQLAEQVAGIHARPLDRRRAPWELHVVTGRENGRAAVYAKVHRALIDESSGADVVQVLLDTDPDPAVPAVAGTEPEEAPPPDLFREALRSLVADPRRLGYAVPGSLQRLRDLAADFGLPGAPLVGGMADIAERLLGPRLVDAGAELQPPRTRLDAPLTAHRRVAIGSLPADHVAPVCAHHGMTVQELVTAATAAALRRWMLDHDALPPAPLVAVVPLPVLNGDVEATDGGLRISPVPVQLPTHLGDPVDRAATTREALRSAAEHLDPVSAATLRELAATAPTALAALTARSLAGLAVAPRTSANVTVAHVTGSDAPLYLAGARVEEVASIAALGPATGGLAVTSLEHDGRLDIALTACREIVPDVWRLLGYLTDAVDELLPSS
jgi:diacylglycerol O-acyltransferase / wax synthase